MSSLGMTQIRTGGCRKKDDDHLEFLCELCEVQVARCRYFVHELTSEVNSRMEWVAKIIAMLGTKTKVAGLCMFRRTRICSTQVFGRSPTRDKLACGCEVNAQARIDTFVLTRATQSRKGNKQERGCVRSHFGSSFGLTRKCRPFVVLFVSQNG